MKNFYFTFNNILKAADTIVSKMISDGTTSIEITTLKGIIPLPGGGNIGSQKAIVSLTADKKLIINRGDRPHELPHEYPLDSHTLQWMKNTKIPIHLLIWMIWKI